jgi:hypothetical protein
MCVAICSHAVAIVVLSIAILAARFWHKEVARALEFAERASNAMAKQAN